MKFNWKIKRVAVGLCIAAVLAAGGCGRFGNAPNTSGGAERVDERCF